MTHQQILKFISRVRNSHSEMENIFTKGSCLNFHLILKAIIPNAKLLYNIDHVITEINGKYYDITGEIKDIKGYLPMSEIYPPTGIKKAYKQLLRSEYKICSK